MHISRYANIGNTFLTDDQVRTRAPSAFAASAHDSRSSRYSYIPTSEVLAGMRREGFVPTQALQSGSRDDERRGFAKHMIRFRREGAAVARMGELHPEIALINSHDGSSAYKLVAGVFRVICCNGLMVGDSFEEVTVRHTGEAVREVIEGSFRVISDAEVAAERAADMRQITLSREERIAFATSAHQLRFEGTSGAEAIEPEQLLAPRRREDRAADLWTTFNVIQENVIRGGLSGRATNAQGMRRTVRSREIRGIDQNTSLNRALWTLTEQMARLKSS